ncbi:MAG: hypothetical protein JWM05_3263, partial [Acidimicrobiales bacterium]|nr:hypothetical protein [Acidimicrobiales bacterium]
GGGTTPGASPPAGAAAQQRLSSQVLDQLAKTQHQSSAGVLPSLFGPVLGGAPS